METYTEHQLKARVTDLEHALSEIVSYLDGLNPAGLVADYGHAYAAGSLEAEADIAADALGLDWTTDLGVARRRVGDRVALQGNLEPCVLYAPAERIRDEVAGVLAAYGHGSGHVFNLGHGVHQYVQPENVGVLVDAVHELSARYHS